MALEILLKAAVLREVGELGVFERPSSQTAASREEQLQRLTFNYERARYLYEASLPYTREERRAREESFAAGTLPVEEWDIVYHVELVELITGVLVRSLSHWVPEWYSAE